MVQMNRFAGQKLRHRCREQTYGHEVGERGRGVGVCVKKKTVKLIVIEIRIKVNFSDMVLTGDGHRHRKNSCGTLHVLCLT